MVSNGYKWVKPDYNASMTMLGGQVLKLFASQSEGLGYKSRKQRHALLSPDRAPAKFSEVASPATGRLLVVVVRNSGGKWI